MRRLWQMIDDWRFARLMRRVDKAIGEVDKAIGECYAPRYDWRERIATVIIHWGEVA